MNTRTTAAALAVALAALLVPCALSGADDPPAPVPAPPTAANAEEAKKTWEWMLKEYLFSEDYQKSPRYEGCGVLVHHWVALVDYDLAHRLLDGAINNDGRGIVTVEKTWEFGVHEGANLLSSCFGKIVVRMSLRHGVEKEDSFWIDATYVPEGDAQPVDFKPDLVDLDFGYTGLFHHTFIERSGAWFKLPKNPLPRPGWVNLSVFTPFPHVISVNKDYVYTIGQETVITPIDVHPAGLTCRKVLPNEDPCCAGLDPIVPENVIMIPYSELYDADGHFRLRVACPRGC